ncbi:MAG TPA: hypothetical protein D7H92_01210 [Candidatus Poseidoniales archaeon]|nr:MAG TPA: hypothetical protein D7H92_01210 [Candidatus Poseidoniales archaeon]|tara:strand:- start:5538 stop:7760 length:2223 start_codon:yes stop_codon:yes gene_type:complete
MRRDDEAVSAAVATVLLFGGVLSIIGLMMVSMMPVIEEMEGSVERHDMSSQMTLLAHETSSLSERGMPGDVAQATLIPVDGELVWDSLRGGMWYSATWAEDMSLRARGALDFDDTMEIRHPESFIEAVCITDLRLGPDRPYHYTLEAVLDSAVVTVTPGLAMPLGPIDVSLYENGEELLLTSLRVDEMATFDLENIDEATLTSSHALNVYGLVGNGGATYVLPNSPEPADKRGQAWSIPVMAGQHAVQLLSDKANQIHITVDGETTIHYATPNGLARTGVHFHHEMNLTKDSVVHITTSTASRLLLKTNTASSDGVTAWPSTNGAYLGNTFLPPHLNGTLRFANPGESVVTITWRGGGISVAAGSFEHVSWPPAYDDGAATLDADGDVFVTWGASTETSSVDDINGTMLLPADDTGAISGGMFSYANTVNDTAESLVLRLAGYTSTWNATGVSSQTGVFLENNNHRSITLAEGNTSVRVETGHPLRVLRTAGEAGLLQLPHDGERRCTSIDTQASGWISTDLPWERMGGRGEIDTQKAWREGRHPASLSIDVLGDDGVSSHGSIGSVWAFHLSRLSYQFASSIDGMEVAFSGGAVVTNHPEFKPYVVVPPSDRGGPGPRFAATIPSLHPTASSESGAGELELDIELVHRTSLASTPAYEVRRGWSEPYGTAIADDAGIGLEASEDWTVYPGRLDLLTDYVGWVPDPSYGTAEAVWHTNGEIIEFTLQLASIDVTTREVMV